jgi:hypothetical protein
MARAASGGGHTMNVAAGATSAIKPSTMCVSLALSAQTSTLNVPVADTVPA